ncbi:hypothetical protein DM860_003720 [Cuscuta australis]|uniref:WIBG Mago-binding domain-containing protein n=1 Tax=Cuscuta australis TaxID=267555 RepID=A0A328DLC3_9ASTE|nr:hypothetical protein DM860_003720 [Cuscuta australis]
MASSPANRGGEEAEEAKRLVAAAAGTPKAGERIIAPTRRPDGTLRKPIRIKAGYVPQDEVAIYKSKGALWKKEMEALKEVPPGYDPAMDAPKAKSKAAKRNERKKEKRLQVQFILSFNAYLFRKGAPSAPSDPTKAAREKGDEIEVNDVCSAENQNHTSNNMETVVAKMNELVIYSNHVDLPPNSNECSTSEDHLQDIDKKIRALKKKIRLTETQQQKTHEKDMKPEQLEKMAKLEGWHAELKLLEGKKAELVQALAA